MTYVTQRSFESDHQQTILALLLKTAGLFCVIIKAVRRNGAKEEKGNLQYVTTSYIFTCRKFVLQICRDSDFTNKSCSACTGSQCESAGHNSRGRLHMFFVHIIVVISLLAFKFVCLFVFPLLSNPFREPRQGHLYEVHQCPRKDIEEKKVYGYRGVQAYVSLALFEETPLVLLRTR